MNIKEGFKIDVPDIFIPWCIDEQTLIKLLNKHSYNHVTKGYYTISCKSLSGLDCMLGFHFEPRKDGLLKELEFFRNSYSDQSESFYEFQSHFEKAFGKPSKNYFGNEGYENYLWDFDSVQIVHYVIDRFGPEEHMRIKFIKTEKPQKSILSKIKSWF